MRQLVVVKKFNGVGNGSSAHEAIATSVVTIGAGQVMLTQPLLICGVCKLQLGAGCAIELLSRHVVDVHKLSLLAGPSVQLDTGCVGSALPQVVVV